MATVKEEYGRRIFGFKSSARILFHAGLRVRGWCEGVGLDKTRSVCPGGRQGFDPDGNGIPETRRSKETDLVLLFMDTSTEGTREIRNDFTVERIVRVGQAQILQLIKRG